jgi:hypothetical protein
VLVRQSLTGVLDSCWVHSAVLRSELATITELQDNVRSQLHRTGQRLEMRCSTQIQ